MPDVRRDGFLHDPRVVGDGEPARSLDAIDAGIDGWASNLSWSIGLLTVGPLRPVPLGRLRGHLWRWQAEAFAVSAPVDRFGEG